LDACNKSVKTDKVAVATGVTRVALITGASSGIGAAIAKKLAREGLATALVARRIERLSRLQEEITWQGGVAEIFAADLSVLSDRERIFRQVHEQLGRVDVLVNNAGFGWYGYYAEMPWEIASQMLAVNVAAVAHLVSLILPQMRSRDSGHIINIGSVAGSFPNQGVALYSASKSFLDAFSTVLHRELAGTHVRVSVVRAGPVRTEFFEQAARLEAGGRVPAERFGVSAERVAERVWKVLRRPRRVVYIPRALAIAPWLELLFGGLVDRLGPLLLRRSHTPM
jgi:uncharacterized protein